MYFSSGIVWFHVHSEEGMCSRDVLRLVTIRRPVTAFWIPGVIILVIGICLAYQALLISVQTGAWSPTITLVSMLLMGMLLFCIAVILYAVAQMIQMVGSE